MTGVEPAASGSGDRRSGRLSYAPSVCGKRARPTGGGATGYRGGGSDDTARPVPAGSTVDRTTPRARYLPGRPWIGRPPPRGVAGLPAGDDRRPGTSFGGCFNSISADAGGAEPASTPSCSPPAGRASDRLARRSETSTVAPAPITRVRRSVTGTTTSSYAWTWRPVDRPVRSPSGSPRPAPGETGPGGMDPGRRGMRVSSDGTRSRRTIHGSPPCRGSAAPASGPHPVEVRAARMPPEPPPRAAAPSPRPGTRCPGGPDRRAVSPHSRGLTPGRAASRTGMHRNQGDGQSTRGTHPGGARVEADPSPRPGGAVRRAGGTDPAPPPRPPLRWTVGTGDGAPVRPPRRPPSPPVTPPSRPPEAAVPSENPSALGRSGGNRTYAPAVTPGAPRGRDGQEG